MDAITIGPAEAGDLDALADLWFSAWQDAHAAILPAELTRLRTRASFRERLQAALGAVRVARNGSRLLGFSLTKEDELYQLFLAREARGTGVAGKLMSDALTILRRAGHRRAWLACAIGNDRAARFYEKTGWTRAATITSELPTPEGVFLLDVWRYEIAL